MDKLMRLGDRLLTWFLAVYYMFSLGSTVVAWESYHASTAALSGEADQLGLLASCMSLAATMVFLVTVVLRMRTSTIAVGGCTIVYYLLSSMSFDVALPTLCAAGLGAFLGTRWERPVANWIETRIEHLRRHSIMGRPVHVVYQGMILLLLLAGIFVPRHAAMALSLRAGVIKHIYQPLPEMQLVDAEDKSWDFRDYRGKYVMLHFWATWCGPCIAGLDEWNHVHEEIKDRDDVVLFGVSRSASREKHVAVCEQRDVTWPQLYHADDSTEAAGLPVTAIPVTWIVGPDGNVIDGNLLDPAARSFIAQLLSDVD